MLSRLMVVQEPLFLIAVAASVNVHAADASDDVPDFEVALGSPLEEPISQGAATAKPATRAGRRRAELNILEMNKCRRRSTQVLDRGDNEEQTHHQGGRIDKLI